MPKGVLRGWSLPQHSGTHPGLIGTWCCRAFSGRLVHPVFGLVSYCPTVGQVFNLPLESVRQHAFQEASKVWNAAKIYLITARLFASPRWGEADTSAKHSERVRGGFCFLSHKTRQKKPLTRLLRNHPLPHGERERVFDILCNCELLFQQNNNSTTFAQLQSVRPWGKLKTCPTKEELFFDDRPVTIPG